VSKECVQITTEIITEKFSEQTIMEMSQTQLPRKAEHMMQVMQKQQQLGMQQQQAMQRMQQLQAPQAPPQGGPPGAPPGMGMPQGGPPPPGPASAAPGGGDPAAEIQAALQQAQSELESFASKPTYEDVMMFLRSNRARNFVLDIETDSTIQFDEQKEKQSRAEFLQVLAPMLQQVGAMVSALPTLANFAGEILKFGVAPYRVGRQLDNAIDEAVQTMMAAAGQAGQGGMGGPGDKNAKDTAASDAMKAQVEREKLQWQTQENEKERQLKIAELQMKGQLEMRKLEQEQQIARLEYEGNEKERQAKIVQINAQMQRDQQKGAIDQQNASMKMGLDAQKQRIVQQGMQEKNSMQRTQMAQKAQDNVLNRNMKMSQFDAAQKAKMMPKFPGGGQ
jgi:hypothetical protein